MSEREWRFYIDDMIAFAERVLDYTKGLDQAGFVADRMVFDATLRNLELVGEAATHVPDEVRRRHPAMPWRQAIATRNNQAGRLTRRPHLFTLRSMTDVAPLGFAAPDAAPLLARGVARLLAELRYACLVELVLRNGRRVDVIGLDGRGKLVVVEIKRSVADFRADGKWPEYLDYCDAFFFAVPQGFPVDILPDDTGLMLADRYGAEIVRAAPANPPLHASRRREVTIRFAQAAAGRLQGLLDPPV